MTKKHLTRMLGCGALALIGVCCLPAHALDPNVPPGGNFNLTNFYLGLPVDSSGGTDGDSASISAALLTAGYSNALYFYSGPDGAMTFWAPVTGATTSGSSYPRSELREQISPPSNEINWRGYGTHLLNATCRVTEVASTKKVIIGQIHTKTGDARPLVKLQYNDGTIEALVKVYASDSMPNTDNKLTFPNVGLGNSVVYTIKLENGLATVTVNGLSKATNTFLTDPDWANQEFYFKAGSYCQDNAGPTNEGARVAFYALTRSHAPSITNQPASRTVVVGSNTTFSVSAAGNGPLRYQWLFNATNLLANATNAAYTLTNAQSSSDGGYSVKVADSLGSVTSTVAALTVLLPPNITMQPTNQLIVAGSNASFTALATGSSPLSYRWYFNTNTPVADATNATLTLTNVALADAGKYSVLVTNAAGSNTSSFASLTVNRPPVAGVVSTVTGQGVVISTTTAQVLAVATDPDGDTVSLSSVNPASQLGGTVWMTNSLVWYVPAPGFTGSDQWNYTLTDSRGASAGGAVTVMVVASNAITLLPVNQSLVDEFSFHATFLGVPGLIYTVDRATNLSGPWELDFTNLTATTNGTFGFSDSNTLPATQRFYRVRYP